MSFCDPQVESSDNIKNSQIREVCYFLSVRHLKRPGIKETQENTANIYHICIEPPRAHQVHVYDAMTQNQDSFGILFHSCIFRNTSMERNCYLIQSQE